MKFSYYRAFFFLLLMTVPIFLPQVSHAKTYAYLVSTDAKIAKLDTDSNEIISTSELKEASGYVQSGDTSVIGNGTKLFVVAGRLKCRVLVYDLKTLAFIKDLDIETPEPDIRMFATPDGKKVFVVWWNTKLEGGAWQFDLYDGDTLEKIKTLDFYFDVFKITFSKDGSKLYSINDGDDAKIDVIDTNLLKKMATIDLNTIWRTDIFGATVPDYKNSLLLISETEKEKLIDPSKDTLFVYDIENKTSSSRISTGMSGDEKLLMNGYKIIQHPVEIVRHPKYGTIKYFKSLGQLYVYDVTTGKKLGVIPFTVDKTAEILGIHPHENKVYVSGSIGGESSVLVFDVDALKMIKTIKDPVGAMFMIFYDN